MRTQFYLNCANLVPFTPGRKEEGVGAANPASKQGQYAWLRLFIFAFFAALRETFRRVLLDDAWNDCPNGCAALGIEPRRYFKAPALPEVSDQP
jgi:hypothetical protein